MKNTRFYIYIGILLFLLSCEKEEDRKLGPYKPVNDVDNIIILGSSGNFFAYNVKEKSIEEHYSTNGVLAMESGYAAGHLILTFWKGDSYNINISTGKVTKSSFKGRYYLPTENDSVLESTSTEGRITYRYNVVTNKTINTFQHPIQRQSSTYSIKSNGIIYWFPDTYLERQNYRYLLTSNNDTIQFRNQNIDKVYSYRKNDFVNSFIRNSNTKPTLEKIENLIPLETIPFFKKEQGTGGFSETMLYKDKVIVFSTSEAYLLDSLGNQLFQWGDLEQERDYSSNHKSIYNRISKTIFDDKLYVSGEIYNSQSNPPQNIICCVEIDLITGEDYWIEVFNGY